MTHLRIELNNIQENVSSAVIEKLYELASSGDLDLTSNLAGNLHTDKTYRTYSLYLNSIYPDLTITADLYYIAFQDKNVLNVLATKYGDGIGITELLANSIVKITLDTGFRNNLNITSFNELSSFPNLRTIEGYSFANCANLESIDVSNITALWTGVFLKCVSLQYIDISSIQLSVIPNLTFEGCTSLLEVTIPLNILLYGDLCFSNCSNLLSIINYSDALVYGSNAFRDCTNLSLSIDLSNATQVGSYCFSNCSNITISNLPSNINCAYGNQCFVNVGNTSITIPSTMTITPSYFFSNCSKLVNVYFEPNSLLTEITEYFLLNCPLITELVIPEGVTKTGNLFVHTMQGLTKVDLPSTITLFGRYCFSVVNSLNTIIMRATTPPTLNNQINIPNTCVIYVPDSSVQLYKEAAYWSNKASLILPLSNYNPS